MIERCAAFASSHRIENCRFLANSQLSIPVGDASFDVAISYDVFEHVSDPRAMLEELHRVLVTRGAAVPRLRPYYGALSHHLNYITRLPALHGLFDPQTLVNAVNRMLRAGGETRFGTAVQPDAPMSYGGRRRCIPATNGMTGAKFLELVGGIPELHVVDAHCTPLLERFRVLGAPGAWLNRLVCRLGARADEAFSFNLVCILERASRDASDPRRTQDVP